MAKKKERTITQIREDKSGKRTLEEVRRLDEMNTRRGKLYKSIMKPALDSYKGNKKKK